MDTNVNNGNTVAGSPDPGTPLAGGPTRTPTTVPGTADPFAAASAAAKGLAEALAGVPGWTELSKKESKALVRPPAGWLGVVPGIVKMLEAHPELGLGVIDAKGMNEALSFVNSGSAVEGSLARAQKGLRDTVRKAGSDLWSEVLKVYGVAQQKLSLEAGLAAEIAPMAALVSKGAQTLKRKKHAAKRLAHPAGAPAGKTEAATPPATSGGGTAEPAPPTPAPEPGPAPTTQK